MIKKIERNGGSTVEYILEILDKINEIIEVINNSELKTKKMKPGSAYDLSAIDHKMRGRLK